MGGVGAENFLSYRLQLQCLVIQFKMWSNVCSITNLVKRCFLASDEGRMYRQEYQDQVWGDTSGETRPCLESQPGVKFGEPNIKGHTTQDNNKDEDKLLRDIDDILEIKSGDFTNNGEKEEEQNLFCISDDLDSCD